jgi:RNA polymerase sigma-70 factor (ECF subfamily)
MSSFPANPVIDLCLTQARSGTRPNASLEEEVLDLFDLLGARLLAYAMSFGIPVQDGEDVVQETFLALFQHLRKQGSRENLKGWLYQVTHNLALKRRYRKTVEVSPSDSVVLECLDPRPGPEEQVLFGERHALLQSALSALPLVDQSCLRLRADGLRYREIAKILGISLGSVAASLARSLARLERAEGR